MLTVATRTQAELYEEPQSWPTLILDSTRVQHSTQSYNLQQEQNPIVVADVAVEAYKVDNMFLKYRMHARASATEDLSNGEEGAWAEGTAGGRKIVIFTVSASFVLIEHRTENTDRKGGTRKWWHLR